MKKAAAASQTMELYFSFWKRAYEQELRLPFATKAQANSFRMRLYQAVRPFREHPKDWDEKAWAKAKDIEKARYAEYVELNRIIGVLEAVAQELPDGSGVLILRKVENNPELARLAAIAGIPWGMEADAMGSQQRMLEQLKITPINGLNESANIEGMPSHQDMIDAYWDDDDDESSSD